MKSTRFHLNFGGFHMKSTSIYEIQQSGGFHYLKALTECMCRVCYIKCEIYQISVDFMKSGGFHYVKTLTKCMGIVCYIKCEISQISSEIWWISHEIH